MGVPEHADDYAADCCIAATQNGAARSRDVLLLLRSDILLEANRDFRFDAAARLLASGSSDIE